VDYGLQIEVDFKGLDSEMPALQILVKDADLGGWRNDVSALQSAVSVVRIEKGRR
jgi:hypothetical protein